MAAAVQPKRVLVMGLGNLLTGDDSFGPRVVECLCRKSALLPDADLLHAGTDLLDAIDRLSAYQLVVVVDAVLDPTATLGAAGQILVIDEEKLLSWPYASPSIHQVSPLLALKLFRQLNPEAATRIVLVALCTREIKLDPSGTPGDDVIARGAEAVLRLLSSGK